MSRKNFFREGYKVVTSSDGLWLPNYKNRVAVVIQCWNSMTDGPYVRIKFDDNLETSVSIKELEVHKSSIAKMFL